MSYFERNKKNILYIICVLIILTIFLPYYSITSEGNISTSYGGASASLSFEIKGASLDSIFIVPLLALLTMYFIYIESKFATWGFAILSIIALAYLTHIIGVSSVSGSSSAHSSVGGYSVSANASAKATPSASYGLLFLFILSIIGYYIRYSLYSNGNANIKVIKVLYVFSIIISVLSFLNIFLFIDMANDYVARGYPYPQEAIISIIGALDIILLWPIMRIILLKNRLELLEDQDVFVLENIAAKKKIIKVLSIIAITIMSILILYSCTSNSVRFL
jgi:hypothetical protein